MNWKKNYKKVVHSEALKACISEYFNGIDDGKLLNGGLNNCQIKE